MTADLPTVRAAIEAWVNLNVPCCCTDAHKDRGVVASDCDTHDLLDAVPDLLAKLSDPAVMDELARWLVAQEDGPFQQIRRTTMMNEPQYRLRQRTRSEPT